MSEPRSIRFEPRTIERLATYAAQRPGVTSASAAARLVEEGLRMDAHPGVLFRDGPAGRRAVLIGGPDVWEVIRAIRDARATEPDLPDDEVLSLVERNTGVAISRIRIAIDYFGDFPDEIDARCAQAHVAERERELAHQRTSELLRA